MFISEKYQYNVNNEIITWNVYQLIQSYSTCEFGSSLSEHFQVLKDEPNRALWRINQMIDINGAWLGQLVYIDLEKNIISFGTDCAVKGQSINLYDMKHNYNSTVTYKLV